MNSEWISNRTLKYFIRGPPKYLFFSILGVFLVLQFVYYTLDLNNFSKYFNLRGEFVGKEDFITFLYRAKPRSDSENIVVTIGGDIRYGPGVMNTISNKNYTKPLAAFADVFGKSDINFINLDGPITNTNEKRFCTQSEKELNRCCTEDCFWKNDRSIVSAMKELGINGIGIENDHTFDYGREGVEDTIYTLKDQTVPFAGLGYKILYAMKDCNVTVLNYNWAYQGEEFYNRVRSMMINDLRTSSSDTYIVIIHGGNQNGGEKTDFQEQFAKAAIDNGANIVVGTHSRVKQEFEVYKERYIYYGIGSILDETSLEGETDFSLLQFEVRQCRNIINVKEIAASRDMNTMEVIKN